MLIKYLNLCYLYIIKIFEENNQNIKENKDLEEIEVDIIKKIDKINLNESMDFYENLYRSRPTNIKNKECKKKYIMIFLMKLWKMFIKFYLYKILN